MAAPHVAGVAALLLAEQPGAHPVAGARSGSSGPRFPRTSDQCPQPCGAGLLAAAPPSQPPPPPPTIGISLTLDQPDLSTAETTIARARVTENGAPSVGRAVTFTSASPSVASISPGSVFTDAGGQAQTILRGVSRGDTTVTATADGAADTKPVRVPDLSLPAVLLILAVVAALILRRRNTSPPGR